MVKLTADIKEYIEKNKKVSNRQLMSDIATTFDIKVSHVAIGNYKKSLSGKILPNMETFQAKPLPNVTNENFLVHPKSAKRIITPVGVLQSKKVDKPKVNTKRENPDRVRAKSLMYKIMRSRAIASVEMEELMFLIEKYVT